MINIKQKCREFFGCIKVASENNYKTKRRLNNMKYIITQEAASPKGIYCNYFDTNFKTIKY